jgi:glutamate 5-kinase
LARGIVNYASNDLRSICGVQSEDIDDVLGFFYGDEVIHRNHMVLL